MKFSFVRAGMALAMVAAIAGCGGKQQFVVQGTISGLNNSGLVLANGGEQISVPSGATSFAFSKQISYGTDYNITFVKQPDHMTCQIGGATGSAGYNVAIQAVIACSQNAYTLGGQYSGLTPAADGTARTVTLINGSTGGTVTLSSGVPATSTTTSTLTPSGEFTLSGQVPDGQAYGVTIVPPTNGLNCTLTNGTGVMHDAAVTNMVLTCQ
ncbi:hypothetical protein FHW58_004477 [Duganella sp. 1224]|uniref:hypothetical protein n=1 Tax=Duganella sp. 1224 TaxID=2587052 RepID=UPI0015CBC51D|nr:hypothetical protein [Duganella sp. 1224]NYE63249.1 hypothetical protein [Duganella sp. 1224]